MNLQQIGEEIRRIRTFEAKLKQKDLAKKAGVYRTDLSSLETKGQKISGLEIVESILNAMGYELTVQKKNALAL